MATAYGGVRALPRASLRSRPRTLSASSTALVRALTLALARSPSPMSAAHSLLADCRFAARRGEDRVGDQDAAPLPGLRGGEHRCQGPDDGALDGQLRRWQRSSSTRRGCSAGGRGRPRTGRPSPTARRAFTPGSVRGGGQGVDDPGPVAGGEPGAAGGGELGGGQPGHAGHPERRRAAGPRTSPVRAVRTRARPSRPPPASLAGFGQAGLGDDEGDERLGAHARPGQVGLQVVVDGPGQGAGRRVGGGG